MPSETETLPPLSPDRPRLRFQWWWIALAVVVIAVIVVLPRAFTSPSTVHQVSIVNETPYALDVQLTGGSKDGWIDLSTAERDTTTVVSDVVDQGKTWTFRLESQGVDGGELSFSRDALAHSGWKVVIPASVGTRLAGEGASPTPPPGF